MKVSYVLSLCFLVLLNSPLVASTASKSVDVQVMVTGEVRDVKPDNNIVIDETDATKPEFVPTHEWQEILPGQHVEAGLHYRMDLAAGKKYAKLMEGKEPAKLVVNSSDNVEGTEVELNLGDEKHYKNLNSAKAEELLLGLPEPDPELVSGLFANMPAAERDALVKKVWARRQRELQLDSQKAVSNFSSMNKLLQTLLDIEASEESKIQSLVNLEYYVADIDNAVDFVSMGGIQVSKQLLRSESVEIREKAFWVIGTTVKDQKKLQKVAVDVGILSILVQAIEKFIESNKPIHQQKNVVTENKSITKVLYCLTSLLRGSKDTQIAFSKLNGEVLLTKLMSNITSNHPTNRDVEKKIVPLVGSLASLGYTADAFYPAFRDEFRKPKWCEYMMSLLDTFEDSNAEDDIAEKLLNVLHILTDGKEMNCRSVIRDKYNNLLKDVREMWSARAYPTKNTKGEVEDEVAKDLVLLVDKLNTKLST